MGDDRLRAGIAAEVPGHEFERGGIANRKPGVMAEDRADHVGARAYREAHRALLLPGAVGIGVDAHERDARAEMQCRCAWAEEARAVIAAVALIGADVAGSIEGAWI